MSDIINFLPIDDMKFESVVSALSETTDWGQLFVGVSEAHKHTRGSGVTVAVLDTGVPNHTDLNANLLTGQNAVINNDMFDHQGHGTHVAGIIAAVENGAGIVGVAPDAKVLPIKVLSDGGNGSYEEIKKGIRIAIDQHADIINMSLGAPIAPPSSFQEIIKEAYDKGIIIVAAAGNDSGAVNYPARYNEVIAVAAIGQNGELANFSSRGQQVAVSAPGVGIYSTYLNNQYAVLNGTSQASPLVAGICALMLSWARNNPTVPQIRNAQDMLKILDDLCDPVGRIGFTGKETNIGFGIPQFANFMPWKA